MKSLKIDENGDIVFNSIGRLVFVEDEELTVQSLNLRFKTQLEELFYNETYGRPPFKGKYNEENILAYVRDTLMQDERVFDVEIASYVLQYDKLNLNVLVYLSEQETIDLELFV